MNTCLNCKYLSEPEGTHVWHPCSFKRPKLPGVMKIQSMPININDPIKDCPTWEPRDIPPPPPFEPKLIHYFIMQVIITIWQVNLFARLTNVPQIAALVVRILNIFDVFYDSVGDKKHFNLTSAPHTALAVQFHVMEEIEKLRKEGYILGDIGPYAELRPTAKGRELIDTTDRRRPCHKTIEFPVVHAALFNKDALKKIVWELAPATKEDLNLYVEVVDELHNFTAIVSSLSCRYGTPDYIRAACHRVRGLEKMFGK